MRFASPPKSDAIVSMGGLAGSGACSLTEATPRPSRGAATALGAALVRSHPLSADEIRCEPQSKCSGLQLHFCILSAPCDAVAAATCRLRSADRQREHTSGRAAFMRPCEPVFQASCDLRKSSRVRAYRGGGRSGGTASGRNPWANDCETTRCCHFQR